jgi:hypothetical protein
MQTVAVEHIKSVNVAILNVSTGHQTASQGRRSSKCYDLATLHEPAISEIVRKPSSREGAQTEASNMAAIDEVIDASQGIAAAMHPKISTRMHPPIDSIE